MMISGSIRAVIIDDERRSREALNKLIVNYTKGIEIVGMADDVITGLDLINEKQPELVFLDVKMKTGTGFDLLNNVDDVQFQVIFTTAFDEYAIKAFRFNAIDYLLKPIGIPELIAAIEKVKINISELNETLRIKELVVRMNRFDHSNPTLTVSTETTIEFLEVKEIIYVQAQGSYSVFHLTSGKKIITSRLLKEFDALLEEYRFFRLHNSYIVNLAQVRRFIKTDGGYVEMKNGEKIPVSRRRKEQFVKSFSS